MENRKWYTIDYADRISEVTVVRETDKSLFILDRYGKARRAAKSSRYNDYFKTREEAVRFLFQQLTHRVESGRQLLAAREQELADFVAAESDTINAVTGDDDAHA